MRCTLLRTLKCVPSPEFPHGIKPKGTEINHADAFWLVRMGVAEPADEACHLAHGLTPDELQAAQDAYEKVDRGIHPNDYAAYDRGEMVGYDPNGKPVPGPNAVAIDDEDETDDEDEPEEDDHHE